MAPERSLKIAFYGHGKWALNTLEMLKVKNNIVIDVIFSRFPNGDTSIENFCKANKIKYLLVKNINTYFEKKNCSYDLGISVSYDQIFKKNSIDSHKKGIINCHAGQLPDFKGRNILNWALINNQSSFGITVHFIDEKIDTGDIITQKNIEIKFTDRYPDLLRKAYIECPKVVMKALDEITKNNYQLISQSKIKKYPIYCSRRRDGDEFINWERKSLDIYNFIRALVKPGPYAKTIINQKVLYVKSAKYINSAPEYIDIPGSIIKKDEDGFLVKTADTYILINDWDCDILVKLGDRFNCGINHS